MANNNKTIAADLTALVADAAAGKGKKTESAEAAEVTRITIVCSWEDKALIEALAKNAGKSQQEVQAAVFAAGCCSIRELQAKAATKA